jgi:hypothetical protein
MRFMTFAETTTICVPPSMKQLQEDNLISQVNHLNACLDEKVEEKEELEMEKENAPLHNRLFNLLKAESQVDVNEETKEVTFNIK